MSEHGHSVTTDTAMDRPFVRIIIGLGIIITLFYFATKAFDDVIDGVVESKYKWVSDRFIRSVNHIHKEWMINHRPKKVVLDYFVDESTSSKITIQLNRYGWPLNVSGSDRELNCLNLWMLFAHEIGHSQSIMDLTSDLKVEQSDIGCNYYHDVDSELKFLFGYELTTGKVTNTKTD